LGKFFGQQEGVYITEETVRIMVGVKTQHSCRELFKKLPILSLPCEYIFSLLIFIINNQEHFQANSAVHSVNTRNKHHLHRLVANLTYVFRKAHIILASKFSTIYQLVSEIL
jgi:hypothetical protein